MCNKEDGEAMVEQVVVRTYPKGWTHTTSNLQNLLDMGYKVVHITPLPDSITEYIVEREVQNK